MNFLAEQPGGARAKEDECPREASGITLGESSDEYTKTGGVASCPDGELDNARQSACLWDTDEAPEGELPVVESLPLPPDQDKPLSQRLHSEPAFPLCETLEAESPFEGSKQLAAWANGSLHGRHVSQPNPPGLPDFTARKAGDCLTGPLGGAGAAAISGSGPTNAASSSSRSGHGALGPGAMRSGPPVAGGARASGTRSGPSAISSPVCAGSAAAVASPGAGLGASVATISDQDPSGPGCSGPDAPAPLLSSSSCPPVSATTPHADGGLLGLDGGPGAWVDTFTMWNSVQRHGEELQRQRRLMVEEPAKSFCVGAPFKVTWPRRLLQRARTQLIVAARVATKDPYTVIIPVFLLVCMLAFGLWGVFSVAYAIADGRRQAAYNAAVDYSNTLKSHIAATVAPASTAATLIKLEPYWPEISQTFYDVAPTLVQKGRETDAILTIVLAPQGIASAIVPSNLPDWAKVLGLDLLREPAWRNDALKTVSLHDQGMVMTGPSRLRAGMMGIVCRYAVFIKDAGPQETFGFNGSAYNCSPCYVPPNSTAPSQRFWGFAQLNVDWEVLIRNVTRMYDLCKRDSLHFNMTYIDPVNGTNRSVAACGNLDRKPVFVNITTMQNTWVLAVSDARGWLPDWMPLVLAVVVLVALWMSITMAIILINRREHMWLLQAMLPKKVIATLRRGEEYAEAFECVTVLFSDIVSYTTLASGMEPIKVVRLLNEMYSAFDTLVDQYECYKVETIGDAFMAVCGTQGEDAIAAAVKMAHLAQAMVERTRVLVSADGQKIQIRIGMHSGPVVGAVVGFKMPHFCLCGDTVNTASRMESNSRPMRIHISDDTAQLLCASGLGFAIERRGPIEVKGKGTMVTHWLLPDTDAAALGGGGGGCDKTAPQPNLSTTTVGGATGPLPRPLPLPGGADMVPSGGTDSLGSNGVILPQTSSGKSRFAAADSTVTEGEDCSIQRRAAAVPSGTFAAGIGAGMGIMVMSADPTCGTGSADSGRAGLGLGPAQSSPISTDALNCTLAHGIAGSATGTSYGTLSGGGGNGGGGGGSGGARAISSQRTISQRSQSRSLSLAGVSLPLTFGGSSKRYTAEVGVAPVEARNMYLTAKSPLHQHQYNQHYHFKARGAKNGSSSSAGVSSSPQAAGGPEAGGTTAAAGAAGGSHLGPSSSGAVTGGLAMALSSSGTRKSKSSSVDLRLFQLGSPMQRGPKQSSRLYS